MISSQPSPDTSSRRILYGRRKGRPLRKRQRELFASLLPEVELTLPQRNQEGSAGTIEVGTLFSRVQSGQAMDLGLEIGFGGGEHLLAQALKHPEIGFIGCEPYTNGVAKLLASIDNAQAGGAEVKNLRIYRGDGRDLLSALPDRCLRLACILFPDPWPKRQHHKRRFIAPETIKHLARILSDNGELRVATDHFEYYLWILRHVLDRGVEGTKSFNLRADGQGDHRRRPPEWPETRYESKAVAAARPCYYLTFSRGSRL